MDQSSPTLAPKISQRLVNEIQLVLIKEKSLCQARIHHLQSLLNSNEFNVLQSSQPEISRDDSSLSRLQDVYDSIEALQRSAEDDFSNILHILTLVRQANAIESRRPDIQFKFDELTSGRLMPGSLADLSQPFRTRSATVHVGMSVTTTTPGRRTTPAQAPDVPETVPEEIGPADKSKRTYVPSLDLSNIDLDDDDQISKTRHLSFTGGKPLIPLIKSLDTSSTRQRQASSPDREMASHEAPDELDKHRMAKSLPVARHVVEPHGAIDEQLDEETSAHLAECRQILRHELSREHVPTDEIGESISRISESLKSSMAGGQGTLGHSSLSFRPIP